MKFKHHILTCFALAAFCSINVSCHHAAEDDETKADNHISDSLFHTLKIDTARVQPVTDAIKFNGMVDYDAEKQVTVFPLVTGNLSGVKVAPGDHVRAGQVLGTIKSAEIANYNSALITAQSNVQQTLRLLTQQKDLYKSGLASEVDVTSAQSAYDQAVAAKVAAQKVLAINGDNKNGEFEVKSPIDGFIVQMNVASGTTIRSDNNAGLFTISDLKDVWVQANVYEQNIGQVHQGDPVKVTTVAYPDKVFSGKVDKLMDVLDPTTKTMKMRVVLQNPDYLLKPQMFVTVALEDKESKTAVAVAAKALIFDNSQYYVLIVTGEKNVQIRPVEILNNNGVNAYIKSGLQSGDRIVASNALLIYGTLNQ
jgi:cobalt-zinc-cadmium efflux system membrane fusion protein